MENEYDDAMGPVEKPEKVYIDWCSSGSIATRSMFLCFVLIFIVVYVYTQN